MSLFSPFFLDFLLVSIPFYSIGVWFSVIFYLPIKAGPVKPEKVEKEEPVTEVSILSLNPFSFSILMSLFYLYFQNSSVVRLTFKFF